MNENIPIPNQKLLSYQIIKLRELILEIQKCCEYRMLFESRKFGLPAAELKCLMLFDSERYLTVKGIAQQLEVAKSRVTKLIQGLMEKELVDRIDDPKDSRIKLISLTPTGRTRSDEINLFKTEIHKKLLLQLVPEERKNVIAHLELLRSTMEAVKETME
jgi:DNA-binding MarR family transcriptional regulator